MVRNAIRWLSARVPEMPKRSDMERNRWLAPISHRFGRSELWRFTRRSVPRGAALGLFAAFILPVGQIFLAAFLALPARANVPVAAAVTFVTNPFTVPFWLLIANKVGRFALKVDPDAFGSAKAALEQGWWVQFGWWLETAGVTAFGFVVLSVVTAALGYLLSSFLWRLVVARKWTRRAGRRKVLHPAE
ncbi:hypothetical protein CP97_07520 [Aurantiacibacter atlanticus]|uniref:DUF2062 domain-containing protein n=2 Tax=Aurantiacibacter atlanticus TaxID=1648404 RepID=A0A0H4VK65_9SPHN|nr:hypothetical protein CP97_07520 [Aurantiacibacter atlanticus]